MDPRCGLVVTTIFDPIVLEDYFRNFCTYDHLSEVKVFVIPDRKTPASVYARCTELRRRGLNVECPTLDEQEDYLKRFGQLRTLIPYDSDNRRNVGYLMALESGIDFLISIDDDNFCIDGVDFYAEHSGVCGKGELADMVATSSGWFNACELLNLEPAVRVYPRGFPYYARHKPVEVQAVRGLARVRINAGLWLREPDLDAMSWLIAPVRATQFLGRSVILDRGTWSPINTQNTAIHRDALVSFYFVRMGYPVAGLMIDRYGDIFSGYFSQACVRHLGDCVRMGTPVAEHRRNVHNHMRDATNELACIWMLEDITSWLYEAKLECSSYREAYVSLSIALEDAVERFKGFIWSDTTRGYFHQMAYCMREWAKACARLM